MKFEVQNLKSLEKIANIEKRVIFVRAQLTYISFIQANIEARIKNEVIFKICVSGAVEKCPYL